MISSLVVKIVFHQLRFEFKNTKINRNGGLKQHLDQRRITCNRTEPNAIDNTPLLKPNTLLEGVVYCPGLAEFIPSYAKPNCEIKEKP
jgi:hypothetical protein